MDRGLWAWTRHPNYFGDACVWWGLWLATIAGWLSLLTVLSPVLMTYFLVYATGARLHREVYGGPPGLPRILFSYIVFRSEAAQIANTMTTLAAADRLPLVTTDLDALLRQVAQRDVDAFATFYDLTRARVFGLVTRVLRDPGYSEETTQDIYLQVWRTAGSYDPAAGSPLAWLLTLAHRRAVDRVRSEQAASQRESRYGAANVDPPADHVADSVILRDERRQVADCLDSLTDVQRECIQLAYYDGLTYAQVSERLSANLATIKSRMRDAIRGLRNCLGLVMTEPLDPDLMALATPYALHAVSESELADIERRLAAAPPDVSRGLRRGGPRRARDDGGDVGRHGRRAARTRCATGCWPR